MTNYYDMILVLVPMTLIGIPGVLHWVGWSVMFTVSLGAFVAAGVVSHALFINAPVDDKMSFNPSN